MRQMREIVKYEEVGLKMIRVSAVLVTVGSSFHHLGIRRNRRNNLK